MPGNHRRAYGARGLAGFVAEQAGAELPRHDPPREQKARQINDLANVIVVSQAAERVADDFLAIAIGEPARSADAQVFAFVDGQWADYRAEPELAFDDQLVVGVTVVMLPDGFAQPRVFDVVQPSYI